MNFKYQYNVSPGMICKSLVNVVVIIVYNFFFFNIYSYMHLNVSRLYESLIIRPDD